MRMHFKHANSKAFELWCKVVNMKLVLKLSVVCCLGSAKGLWRPLLERMCNELNRLKVLLIMLNIIANTYRPFFGV